MFAAFVEGSEVEYIHRLSRVHVTYRDSISVAHTKQSHDWIMILSKFMLQYISISPNYYI